MQQRVIKLMFFRGWTMAIKRSIITSNIFTLFVISHAAEFVIILICNKSWQDRKRGLSRGNSVKTSVYKTIPRQSRELPLYCNC